MASPILIQVVPELAPGRNGVSDQATQLASSLSDEFGIQSAFVVLNSKGKRDLPYAAFDCPPSRLPETCLELTEGCGGSILVHVSGYGYSPDGAPALLADAIEKVRLDGRFRIAAYFHELYALGPPWKSAFWYSRRQQRALRKLVANNEVIITSTTRYAKWLERVSHILGGVPVELRPVFSAAGEAQEPVLFSRRKAAMVVFGLAGTRRLAYRKISQSDNLTRMLGIEEIYDIGPECGHPTEINGMSVKPMGLLPVEELPAVFSQARFGFFALPSYCFGKSSVFASYCAQGVIPVLAEAFSGDAEGLRDGVQVVSMETVDAARKAGLESCARAAWEWYMTHCVRVHAERYARWIGGGQERSDQLGCVTGNARRR